MCPVPGVEFPGEAEPPGAGEGALDVGVAAAADEVREGAAGGLVRGCRREWGAVGEGCREQCGQEYMPGRIQEQITGEK